MPDLEGWTSQIHPMIRLQCHSRPLLINTVLHKKQILQSFTVSKALY